MQINGISLKLDWTN